MNNSAYFRDPEPDTDAADTSYAEAIVVDRNARSLSRPKQNGLLYGGSFLPEQATGACEEEFQAQLVADERLACVR